MPLGWKELLASGETRHIDFKGPLAWEGDHRFELSKDIAAFANTRDGGKIVIGVEQSKSDGRFSAVGLTADQVKSFDPTKLSNFLNERFEPAISLRVERPVVDGLDLVVIEVFEFDQDPVICIKDGQRNDSRQVFHAGQILARTDAAASEVANPQTLRELLGMAVTKKGDHLLEQIRRIVMGNPPPPAKGWEEELSPEFSRWSDQEDEFYRDLKGAGTWSFVVAPVAPIVQPLRHEELRKLMHDAQVSLRGWSFPQYHDDLAQNFLDWIACETEFMHYKERWNLSRRLIFGHVQRLSEDGEEYPLKREIGSVKALSFLNAIYTLTENVLFAKRLVEGAHYDGTVILRVRLRGCRDRRLLSLDAGRILHGAYVCREDEVPLQKIVTSTDLAAGWEEVAADLALELFALFNWTGGPQQQGPSRQMILTDIYNLRDRKV